MKISELKKTQWFRWLTSFVMITSVVIPIVYLIEYHVMVLAGILVALAIFILIWYIKSELLDKIW